MIYVALFIAVGIYLLLETNHIAEWLHENVITPEEDDKRGNE